MTMTIEISKKKAILIMKIIADFEDVADNELDYLNAREVYFDLLQALNKCDSKEELRRFKEKDSVSDI